MSFWCDHGWFMCSFQMFCLCFDMSLLICWLSMGSWGLFGLFCLCVFLSRIFDLMSSGSGWWVCFMFPLGMYSLSAVFMVLVMILLI